jgi:ribosomal protein S12 methylthiotransferase
LENKGKPNIGILSLGCPRNIVDSESILGRLNLKGYPIVDIEKCDVAIVNTCAFLEDAKKESIDCILDLIDLKKEGRLKKIIVYGCLPQRYKYALKKEIPEIDAFVGCISLNHDPKRFSITPKHYAYLKICESCINNCSFCIIPEIKGRFRSMDLNSILERIKTLDEEKVSEVDIIGQDITGYGLDLYGDSRLVELLNRIMNVSRNIGWFRLLYLYPDRISDKFLKLVRDNLRICKYIDLPVQHINDRILKLMNRNTKGEDLLKLIDRIRKTIPGVFLRTSVIVGFPSETEGEFRELLKFIEEAKFERLGAFIYSREEGTKAFDFKKQIPDKIKQERFDMVMLSQQKISKELNEKFLNRTIDVLIDEKEKDYYSGRTQFDAPEVDGMVFVKSKKQLKPGEFVRVRITDTLEYDLAGVTE